MRRPKNIMCLLTVWSLTGIIEAAPDFTLTDNENLYVTAAYNTGTLYDSNTADMLTGGSLKNFHM